MSVTSSGLLISPLASISEISSFVLSQSSTQTSLVAGAEVGLAVGSASQQHQHARASDLVERLPDQLQRRRINQQRWFEPLRSCERRIC
jgi:hypothetical protein